jgi:Flp pilus assembly protein TadD
VRRRVFAALSILVLATHLACERVETPSTLEARAAEALAGRDLEALRSAVDALRSGTDRTPEGLLRGAAWMRRAGQSAEAVWWLQDAVERHPDHVELRIALGDAALAVGNPVLARETIAAIGPPSALPLDALLIDARAELELGRLESALALLETAARQHGDDPRAVVARVATLLREGELERADEALREAADRGLDATSLRPLELLAARVLELRGDGEGARERLESLVAKEPADVAALGALVASLLGAGRFEEARSRVDAAATLAPELPAWSALHARIALAQDDLEAAEIALRRFVAQSDSPGAYLLLASLRRRLAGEAAAAETLSTGIDQHPESGLLRLHRAESWIELGKLSDAEHELPALRESGGSAVEADYLRGRLALARRRPDEAVSRLREVVTRLDRAYTQYWLGRALEETGDLAGAERRYALALTRDRFQTGPALALLRLARDRGDAPGLASAAGEWARREPASAEANATWITALVRAGAAPAARGQAHALTLRFPDEPLFLALHAYTLRGDGRFEEADDVLTSASARFPDDPEIETERALWLAGRGELDEAIARLERAARAHPGDARRHSELAALLHQRGDLAGSEKHLERALHLDPTDPSPLAIRAHRRAVAGAFETALADCDRYLVLRPRDAGVQALRARIFERTGRPEDAIAGYRRAIGLDTRAVAAHNNLALLLADRGELAEARDLAQRAYALAGEDEPEVVDTLGWIYLRSGLTERGVALIERAHEAAPERPTPRLHLALAYRDAGRHSEARALLSGITTHPDLEPALQREAHAVLASLRD